MRDTGVDLLAVSFGNAHGSYVAAPVFDFELLEEIAVSTERPLVLHGGSGTPAADLKRAIDIGIRKVNVATELKKAIYEELVRSRSASAETTLTVALAAAKTPLSEAVARWCDLTGSSGKA